MNPNIVEAKREYTRQLADILTPYVFSTIARIFEANRSRFREMLREVPNWNAGMIADKTQEITMKHRQLQNLITAACVSYTKMLGSIRLNQSAHSNVRVTIPEVPPFIHAVYIYVAKEFFYEPATLLKAGRRVKHDLVEDAVEQAVRELVPIDQLLDAYLSPAVDTQGIDPIAAAFDKEEEPSNLPNLPNLPNVSSEFTHHQPFSRPAEPFNSFNENIPQNDLLHIPTTNRRGLEQAGLGGLEQAGLAGLGGLEQAGQAGLEGLGQFHQQMNQGNQGIPNHPQMDLPQVFPDALDNYMAHNDTIHDDITHTGNTTTHTADTRASYGDEMQILPPPTQPHTGPDHAPKPMFFDDLEFK